MAKVERSILIKAPLEKVVSYLTDPKNELEWLPSLTDVREVTGQGVGKKWSWSYKMIGLTFKGNSEVIEQVGNEKYVYKTMGGIRSTWTFMFNAEDDGTRFNLAVEYTIPIPVLGKLADKLVLSQNEREADLAINNIKSRLES
jgi:carbon monoxide dehydrogenase subunit G